MSPDKCRSGAPSQPCHEKTHDKAAQASALDDAEEAAAAPSASPSSAGSALAAAGVESVDAAVTTRDTSSSESTSDGIAIATAGAGAGGAAASPPPECAGLVKASTLDADATAWERGERNRVVSPRHSNSSHLSPHCHRAAQKQGLQETTSCKTEGSTQILYLPPRHKPALLDEQAAEVSADVRAIVGLVKLLEVGQALVPRGAVAELVAVREDEDAAGLEDAGELAGSLAALLRWWWKRGARGRRRSRRHREVRIAANATTTLRSKAPVNQSAVPLAPMMMLDYISSDNRPCDFRASSGSSWKRYTQVTASKWPSGNGIFSTAAMTNEALPVPSPRRRSLAERGVADGFTGRGCAA